jgi:hypothetical protein
MDVLAALLSVVVFVAVMLRVLDCAQGEHRRVISESFIEICKAMKEAEEAKEK